MYEVNELVHYGAQGVCKICNITTKRFRTGVVKYYELSPVYRAQERILVPMDNEAAIAKMRKVMSREEIMEMLDRLSPEGMKWVENDHLRKEKYRGILRSGDCFGLFEMVRALHRQRRMRIEKGRKLHSADEALLKDAEKILFEELAYVLGMDIKEVMPFMLEELKSRQLILS